MNLNLEKIRERWQLRATLAITVESGRVAVDAVRREASGGRVAKSFVLPMGAEAIVEQPEKVGLELAAKLESAGIRERHCVVCVPANWALTTTAEMPDVTGDDLRDYLELRAEREFPIPVTDLRLAHCAYTLPDGKRRVTLAAVPAKRLDAIERMIAAAGGKLMSISLGLDDCVPPANEPTALHFVANGNHVDVVVAAGGGIAAVRSLPAPVGAEAMTFDAARFSREVRITLGRLPGEMGQQVREASFRGSPMTAETLCLEVRQHLRRLGIDSRLHRTEGHEGNEHPAAAIASASRYLQHSPVAFEFVPPRVDRWQMVQRQFDDRRRRRLAAIGVAAIALPLLAFFVRSRMESSWQAEWQGMCGKVADLEALQHGLRKFRPWFEPTPRTLQAFENLAAAFPEQGDVWTKSIQLSEQGKVTCAGFARNQTALLGLLDRLRGNTSVSGLQVQQVRGENPIQFSIVYQWEANDAP